MATRHLAPIAQYREPYVPGTVPILSRLSPARHADGYVVLLPTGGRFVRHADGYLLTDPDATDGVQATKPSGGGYITIY